MRLCKLLYRMSACAGYGLDRTPRALAALAVVVALATQPGLRDFLHGAARGFGRIDVVAAVTCGCIFAGLHDDHRRERLIRR